MSIVATLFASSASAPGASAHGQPGSDAGAAGRRPSAGAVAVRYQVKDIARSVAFYTERLGFELEQRSGSAFASVLLGNLRLLLSGPGSSGSRPMPGGQPQEPGGWNRVLIDVPDLEASIRVFEQAGVPFRNSIETGPGGSQIMIEDPDGNPIELHQPPPR